LQSIVSLHAFGMFNSTIQSTSANTDRNDPMRQTRPPPPAPSKFQRGRIAAFFSSSATARHATFSSPPSSFLQTVSCIPARNVRVKLNSKDNILHIKCIRVRKPTTPSGCRKFFPF
jgi:hypothetical protein